MRGVWASYLFQLGTTKRDYFVKPPNMPAADWIQVQAQIVTCTGPPTGVLDQPQHDMLRRLYDSPSAADPMDVDGEQQEEGARREVSCTPVVFRIARHDDAEQSPARLLSSDGGNPGLSVVEGERPPPSGGAELLTGVLPPLGRSGDYFVSAINLLKADGGAAFHSRDHLLQVAMDVDGKWTEALMADRDTFGNVVLDTAVLHLCAVRFGGEAPGGG